MSKKEDNPFSFKHFLRKDSSSNYQHAGARPKVYYEQVNSNHCNQTLDESIGVETDSVYSRNPTELPDFVQDHLVIEQCYLNNQNSASSGQMIADIDNLPDFALNSMESKPSRHRMDKKSLNISDLSFDLSRTPEKRNKNHLETSNGMLDESGSSSNYRRLHRNHQNSPELLDNSSINFPLDLPFGGGPVENSSPGINKRSGTSNSPEGSINDSIIPKSLPDFLSDGPIRNRVVEPNIATNSSDTSDVKFNYEIELLRRDLEAARRQIGDKNRRIQMLEVELASRKAVDYEETAHLEKAMEQVEDNLKRSTRRAVNAESAVTSLKKEIKNLTAEISILRMENRELRNSVGASYSDSRPPDSNKKLHRFANDIRDAASSAESLLRQLITGVDNLKILASTLESIDRIEDRTKDFLPDLDQDNAAGPL